MDSIGKKRIMIQFCGQNKCLLDSNGRVKLTPHFLNDFRNAGDSVVLHCLPEGALAVYPSETWEQMRSAEPKPAAQAGQSIVFRRRLRRTGAFTQEQEISKQGRLTIPPNFRPLTGLEAGGEVYLVGTEIGVEIWSREKWEQELALLREHEMRRAKAEMEADVNTFNGQDAEV